MKHRHPTRISQSLLASLLAFLLAAAPALRGSAASARPALVLLPYVALAGVPDALALRTTELLRAELKARDEVRLLPAPAETVQKALPKLGQGGPWRELQAALSQGVLDRKIVSRVAKVAKAAGAQAAVVGVLVNSAEVVSLRSFLVLVRGERVVVLPPLSLDRELLGASLEMLRLADDIQAQLTGPAQKPAALPIALGRQGNGLQAPPAERSVAPPPAGMAAAEPAPEPERRVAIPGARPAPSAPARTAVSLEPAPELVAQKPVPRERSEPSRNLVIPRQRSAEGEALDAPAPPVTSERVKIASPAPQRLEALEPEAIKSVREPAQKNNHALFWIITGALVVGGLAAGGVYLYENGRTPSSATVSATWAH